ncbi:MAG TPA: 30S ribosomal protein THX [Gemmatimonadetes bacterium]|nr:30S ribosomal protein THX [Gemmatimonadota bacterium]
MGRGDKRTEKGKRFKGSHGNTRQKSPNRKTRHAAKKAPTKK